MQQLSQNAAPTRRLIAQGVNAGKPVSNNELILDRLRAAMRVVNILKRHGLTVMDVDQIDHRSPIVYIENCAACADIVEAYTKKWSYDAAGQCQLMEAPLEGFRVRWFVRGN